MLYPIFFNKNKYNKYDEGYNYNNYLKLFEIDKNLYERDPDFDAFNKHNITHKDLCKHVEINVKDLILEERYNYLYPNNASLGKSNCRMNDSNFDLERKN